MRGLLHVQKTLGRLPLAEVLQPAVRLARSGIIIDASQALGIKIVEPVVSRHAVGRDMYFKDGKLIQTGEIEKELLIAIQGEGRRQ